MSSAVSSNSDRYYLIRPSIQNPYYEALALEITLAGLASQWISFLGTTRVGSGVRRKQLGDLSTLEDYIAIEGLKSVVAESKLQELRNEVRDLAFAIWMGRVQGGGSYFRHASSDWFTARNELGVLPDLVL